MGKTSKPLCILIHPDLEDWEEFKLLREQGHTVDAANTLASHDLRGYDVILGPNAHWMSEELRPYLGDAVQAAQRRKFPTQRSSRGKEKK